MSQMTTRVVLPNIKRRRSITPVLGRLGLVLSIMATLPLVLFALVGLLVKATDSNAEPYVVTNQWFDSIFVGIVAVVVFVTSPIWLSAALIYYIATGKNFFDKIS